MSLLTTTTVSLPDRENLVFEISFDNWQVAEISNEPGQSVMIEIYPSKDGAPWRFDLEEFQKLLLKGANIVKRMAR